MRRHTKGSWLVYHSSQPLPTVIDIVEHDSLLPALQQCVPTFGQVYMCTLCLQPTQWHTSAEAPEPSESADANRAGSDWGASTSGRQPVDFIFGFLPEPRKQELAAGRGTTGELDVKKFIWRAWTC